MGFVSEPSLYCVLSSYVIVFVLIPVNWKSEERTALQPFVFIILLGLLNSYLR